MSQPLTTAAPVQLMKFDEMALEPPRHPGRRRAKWLAALAGSIIVALVIAL